MNRQEADRRAQATYEAIQAQLAEGRPRAPGRYTEEERNEIVGNAFRLIGKVLVFTLLLPFAIVYELLKQN